MNRIAALENDLRQSTTRLRERRPRTAVPTPETARKRTAGGAAEAAASALSAWHGAGPAGRSAQPPAPRARALSTLDYRVAGVPMPLRQTSSMACWAFVAAMMASWRDQLSWSVEPYLDSLGGIWRQKLIDNRGLTAAEVTQLSARMGVQTETTQANFTPDAWEQMLREWGPLWVSGDNNAAPGIQGIHEHILVGIHGPSDGDPMVDLIDPGLGQEVRMPMSQFVARYEQLATTTFAGFQIRHWPARAQQAAQLSLSWAQQAVERARQQSPAAAGAVIAGAGLLFSIFKQAVSETNGLSWHRSELRGKVVPGDSEDKRSLSDGQYQPRRLETKAAKTFTAFEDRVGADFTIAYDYNGHCLASISISNSSYAPPGPMSGRTLSVDTNIRRAYGEERNDVAAVEIEIVWQWGVLQGSAGTLTRRITVFGDGREELVSDTWA